MRLTCFLIKAFGRCHFDVEVFLRAFKRDGPQGYAGACVSLYKQQDTIWNLSLELSQKFAKQNYPRVGRCYDTYTYIYIFTMLVVVLSMRYSFVASPPGLVGCAEFKFIITI